MCRLLGVTRSGYYGYQQRQDNQPPDYYHQELIEAAKDIAKASDDSYGSRRMKKAVWQRRPESGLIVHSDRGSQYASRNYRRLLKAHGFVGSMSRKGDCLGGLQELLRKSETRTGAVAKLPDSLRSPTRCAALHIDVVQHRPASFISGIQEPGPV